MSSEPEAPLDLDEPRLAPGCGYELVDGRVVPTAPEPEALPAVDERLILPGRYEVLDGEVLPVPPAYEPHGNRHSKLSALLEAYVAEGFNVAVDMLTRTSHRSDIAPDASVYPRARDPDTGGRQLEHLAFEVLGSQTPTRAGRKARSLRVRGVRRVFAIHIDSERCLEWSTRTDRWEPLELDAVIEDEALALPLLVRDLVTCVTTDDAVARALLAKRNPVIDAALDDRERRSLQQAIALVLADRGVPVSDAQRHVLETTEELALLEHWITRAATCQSTATLLISRPPD